MPDKAADAVIDVDHEVAGRQRGDFGEEIGARFSAAAAAREAVAQNILLADDRGIAGDETRLQPDHGKSHAAVAQGQRLRQVRD